MCILKYIYKLIIATFLSFQNILYKTTIKSQTHTKPKLKHTRKHTKNDEPMN